MNSIVSTTVTDIAAPAVVPTPVRPGISESTLNAAGVRRIQAAEAQTLIGIPEAGILIPYFTAEGTALIVNGRSFHRMRSDNPDAKAKYLSPVGSGCQAYFPPSFARTLGEAKTVYVVEGEFKALSLCEAGIPAMAVGGITSTCPNNAAGVPETLPALAQLIQAKAISEVVFIGDNDTVFIPAFAKEMVKLAKCLSVPLRLLRIPVNAIGKAPDDLIAVLGDGFPNVWQHYQQSLELVAKAESAEGLAERLLKREAVAIAASTGEAKRHYLEGLAKLGAGYGGDLFFAECIADVAVKLGVTKAVFAKQVKARLEQDRKRRVEEQIQDLIRDQDPDLKIYFDGDSYYRKQDGVWGTMIREDARLHLSMEGLSKAASAGESSPVDQALYELQQHNRVDYAEAICGRQAGYLFENGNRILVTDSPAFIEGKAGEWPTIGMFLNGLLGVNPSHKDGEVQLALFKGWLKLARTALRKPTEHLPGQVLGFIGPKDAGKSLLIDHVVRYALGGRSAEADDYLLGKTTFNGNLWGAELLVVSDTGLGDSVKDRIKLRDSLKKASAEPQQKLRGLYKEQLTLRPIWRIVLAGNDTAENITDLPSLDASFSDKIIYLRCFAPTAPLYCVSVQGAREGFTQAIAAELPAFLHEVDNYEIPQDLVKGRFGITEWHHPYIVESLETTSHLQHIVELIIDWINVNFSDHEESKTVSTTELYEALARKHDGKMPGNVCSGVPNLGRQLSSIAETASWKELVKRGERRIGGTDKNQKQTVWTITKPKGEDVVVSGRPNAFFTRITPS